MTRLYSYIFLVVVLSCLLPACKSENVIKEDSITDKETALLDRLQLETFNYFWEGGEPVSGGARERLHMDDIYPVHEKNIITSGGTGFGIMATIVGIERGFITRDQGFERLKKLADWLGKTDRFHGAWPHWWYPDGRVFPFSRYDDGGDLVESSFLVQGMIVARQYFKQGNEKEKAIAKQFDSLWREVEWNWYTKNGEDLLYWHWSPNHDWKMNFGVKGHNECLIMYVLAASSPTYPVEPATYHKGYMRNGDIVTDRQFYGMPTVLDHYDSNDIAVGPLFWSHYSHLGLNPNGLSDQYADFWKLNQNHALIHWEHGKRNPYGYKGYSEECWGLTSSYSILGYTGHNPQEDIGVISPTAALSSFPYTPEGSMKFLKYMYEKQDTLIGKYGPYDAFSLQSNWSVPRYLAIDQLPIPIMVENYRSGLIWNLFMSAPEIQTGLDKLGFDYRKVDSI